MVKGLTLDALPRKQRKGAPWSFVFTLVGRRLTQIRGKKSLDFFPSAEKWLGGEDKVVFRCKNIAMLTRYWSRGIKGIVRKKKKSSRHEPNDLPPTRLKKWCGVRHLLPYLLCPTLSSYGVTGELSRGDKLSSGLLDE